MILKVLALMAFFAIPILLGWEAFVSWLDKDGVYESASDTTEEA